MLYAFHVRVVAPQGAGFFQICSGGEVNHQRRSAALNGRHHAHPVPKVAFYLSEALVGNPGPPEIEAENLVTPLEEQMDQVPADEPCTAGNQ
jgi:hypothetical protein